MKQLLRIVSSVIFALIILQACKKSSGGNSSNLPAPVNTIISQAIIDSMKNWGMTINEGTTPPALNGIYLMSPNICLFDNSRGNQAGQSFDDYKYKFSNQNNSDFTIRLDYKDVGGINSDSGSDVTATYIAGNGNAFTVFARVTGVSYGTISYTRIDMYSGVIASGGIQNFQTAFYMKTKSNDPSGLIVDPGDSRIFYDSDNQSESVTTYSLLPLVKTDVRTNNAMTGVMNSTKSSGKNN
jgi:hypothetical protein